MPTLDIAIRKRQKVKVYNIQIDLAKFENLAASFGFFNPSFLESLERAEQDIAKGRTKKLRTFKQLAE